MQPNGAAERACQGGLYNDVFATVEEMDTAIHELVWAADQTVTAMQGLKRVFWEGTENWDELLANRASISGALILSDEAKDAINAFKKKQITFNEKRSHLFSVFI